MGSIETETAPSTYRYAIVRNGEITRTECGRMAHALWVGRGGDIEYIVHDSWRDLPKVSYLFSSAFSGNYSVKAKKQGTTPANSITVRAICPCLHQKSQALAMVGECVGGWESDNCVALEEIEPNIWATTLDTEQICSGE